MNLCLSFLSLHFLRCPSRHAKLLNSMSKVADTINSGSLPVFGDEATEAEIQGFQDLRGTAYETLSNFMREVESSPPRWSGCLPCCPPLVNWRDSMVQVKNHRTGRYAWVLRTNEEAYLRELGGATATATARAPPS